MDLTESFGSVSAVYDSQRRALIPCFDAFYGSAVDQLAFDTPQPRIVDVGAGTGLLSQKILERFAQARLTLVDMTPKMLEVARARFAGRDNMALVCADALAYPWKNGCDAVVSSLAIHHLPDAQKKELYAKIFAALKPGGHFLNADQVLGDTPEVEALYDARWRAQVERSGLDRAAIDSAYERIKHDRRTPLGTQLGWLKDIGFSPVDCPFKHDSFAVLWGRKPL